MESSAGTVSRGHRGRLSAAAAPLGATYGAAFLPPRAAPGARSTLRRQHTLAKGTFVPAALPLFDVSGSRGAFGGGARTRRRLRAQQVLQHPSPARHQAADSSPSLTTHLPPQVSVAVLSSLASMDEVAAARADMVLASTMHVPAHHLLNCQAESYGTPFR